MSYAKVRSLDELILAIVRAAAEGSGSLTVPMFEGNSFAFDEVVRLGLATGYTVQIELSLPVPKGGAL